MQQPHDNPWFLRDSFGGEPFRDQRSPRGDPDFPEPTPRNFGDPPQDPPQHQFPQPQQEFQSRAFPSPLDRDESPGGDSERGGERGLHFPFHRPHLHQQPPPPKNDNPPPSGIRIPLASNARFPPSDQVGPPVSTDADGTSPVFLGSAIFDDSVHPCKIVPSIRPPCRVAYGGTEREHSGRYDLLPITPNMEWVPTREGKIPEGRHPIEGGYESNGTKLFHALANMDGVKVPGKTGEHLGGANIPFGGYEHIAREYQILCWRS